MYILFTYPVLESEWFILIVALLTLLLGPTDITPPVPPVPPPKPAIDPRIPPPDPIIDPNKAPPPPIPPCPCPCVPPCTTAVPCAAVCALVCVLGVRWVAWRTFVVYALPPVVKPACVCCCCCCVCCCCVCCCVCCCCACWSWVIEDDVDEFDPCCANRGFGRPWTKTWNQEKKCQLDLFYFLFQRDFFIIKFHMYSTCNDNNNEQ